MRNIFNAALEYPGMARRSEPQCCTQPRTQGRPSLCSSTLTPTTLHMPPGAPSVLAPQHAVQRARGNGTLASPNRRYRPARRPHGRGTVYFRCGFCARCSCARPAGGHARSLCLVPDAGSFDGGQAAQARARGVGWQVYLYAGRTRGAKSGRPFRTRSSSGASSGRAARSDPPNGQDGRDGNASYATSLCRSALRAPAQRHAHAARLACMPWLALWGQIAQSGSLGPGACAWRR
ncbi:hypothetical protein C8Q77DRAFT_509651 [Trametes polyzona]|nr:hypothetical protein C8Q77DRAFT_509651 [Trametes polyzona]